MKKSILFSILVIIAIFLGRGATFSFGDSTTDQVLGAYLRGVPLKSAEINRIYAKYNSLKNEADLLHYVQPLLPTLNSAMPLASQRAATQYRRLNFERLQFLADMPARVDNPIRQNGEPVQNQTPAGQNSQVRGQNCCPHAVPSFWVQNYGDFLYQGPRQVDGFRSSSYGISLGADRWIGPRTVLGFGFGGAFADMKTSDQTQRGKADSFIFAGHGAHYAGNGLKMMGSIGYMYSNYGITRTPFGIPLQSRHQGDSFLLSFDCSKTMRTSFLDFTPFFAIDMILLKELGYDEKLPSGITAVTFSSRQTESYIQTIGLRLEQTRRTRWGWLINPSGWFGYIHDYGDGRISTAARVFGVAPIVLPGVSTTPDRAALGLNLNVGVSPYAKVFGGYNGEFGWKFNVQTIHAGLTYDF